MKILGFDPSLTNFGWVLFETDTKTPLAEGLIKTFAKEMFLDRYIFLRESVTSLIEEHQPDRIGLEYPIFHDLFSEGMYGLYLFTMEAIYRLKKDVVLFSPMQVKVHAANFLDRPRGWKMKKADMVEAAKKYTGKKWNHNIADAFWIAQTASRFWLLFEGVLEEGDLSEAERKQFLEVHTPTKGKRKGEILKKGIYHREDDRFFLFSKEG